MRIQRLCGNALLSAFLIISDGYYSDSFLFIFKQASFYSVSCYQACFYVFCSINKRNSNFSSL